MKVRGVSFESSRYNFDKRQSVTVLWVHIGMNLKDKTGKVSFMGVDDAFIS